MLHTAMTRYRHLLTLLLLAIGLAGSAFFLLGPRPSVDAAPEVPGSLSGIIRGNTGLPLPGLELRLYRGYNLGTAVQTTTTDGNGAYHFTLLSAGLYRLMINDPSHQYPTPQYYPDAVSLQAAADLLVTAGIDTQVDIQLQTGGRLRGRVTAPDGTPLANVEVSVYSRGDIYIPVQQTVTDAAGNYEATGFASGYYYLYYHDLGHQYFDQYYGGVANRYDATIVGVSAGGMVDQLNTTLLRGATIAGTVRGDKGVMAGIMVAAVPRYGYTAVQTATTDEQGNYRVGPLSSDFYKVLFTDPADYYAPAFYDNPDFMTEDGVSVIVGTAVTGIDVLMTQEGIVRGRVTAEDGTPLADIAVVAQAINISSIQKSAKTIADGTYELHGLPSDYYRVEFSNPAGIYVREYYSNTPLITAATLITTFPGEIVTNINASLTTGGVITGTAIFSGENPFNIITVQAIHSSAPLTQAAATAVLYPPQITYTLGGLLPGEYRVRAYGAGQLEYYINVSSAERATPVQVAAGQVTPGIDFVLNDNADAATISGTVRTAAGQPLAKVAVRAYCYACLSPATGATPADENALTVADPEQSRPNHEVATGPWQVFATVYTDETGQYQFSTLYPGRYRLRFSPYTGQTSETINGNYAFAYYNNAIDLATATDLELTPHLRLGGVDATLDAGATMTGVVTFDNGVPVPNGLVGFYFWDGFDWVELGSTLTDAETGAYRRPFLQSGRYRVEARGYLQGEEFQYFYGNGIELTEAADVAITAGVTTPNINIVVPTAFFFSSGITGTVTANGEPVAGIRVEVYDGFYSSDRPVIDTTTDAAGHYAVYNLRQGRYFVGFFDPTGRYAVAYNDDQTNFEYAQLLSDFSLARGAVITHIDAALVPGGALQGRVVDLVGQGITQIQVEALAWDDRLGWSKVLPAASSADDGAYQLTGLAPGSYRLAFFDPHRRYAARFYGDVSTVERSPDISITVGSTTTLPNLFMATTVPALSRQLYFPLIRQ